MAIKKSELYSSLWKSCDELRGGMDASQYKDYVLVLLFVKYVSDKYAGQPNALIEVPEGGSFADMVALKGDKEIGDKINKIIARLAEANDLKGVIDVADFNDADKLGKGKEMQDRLSNLVAIFDNPALNFRKNRAEGDDILGDAYEYLMRHFATESGKSKGQFYTPAEVSRIIAKVIGINKARSHGFDPAHDLYERFVDGVPPKKNGDYAFLLHIIRSLKSTGKGAVILPHGVLFRGNAEADIRTNIIRKGYIKGIIGLPPNLFYGTGIPACIIVIDKENATGRTGIFMIDASKGFVKDGNKNRLRHQDIHKIVDVFNKQIEVPKYSHMVSVAEIAANDYNLNIPRYIDSTEDEDLHNIAAHLLGGIPNYDVDALDNYWQVFPTLKQQLFEAGPRAGYSQLRADIAQIKLAIFTHPEFVAYIQAVTALFEQWQTSNTPCLKSLGVGSHPKQLIEALSEDLLRVFAKARLIDKYDVYQHLMSYWTDTMQDDVYMIALHGCKASIDLIPPQLIINRYFAADQQTIEKLEAAKEAIVRKMEEMDEEHGGEGGLLEEAKNEKGKVTKPNVKARL